MLCGLFSHLIPPPLITTLCSVHGRGAFDDVFLELDGFIGDLVDNDLNEDIDVEALEAKRLRELEELRGLDADEMEHMADLEALLGAPAVDEEVRPTCDVGVSFFFIFLLLVLAVTVVV